MNAKKYHEALESLHYETQIDRCADELIAIGKGLAYTKDAIAIRRMVMAWEFKKLGKEFKPTITIIAKE
jgi:hypothetical protein